MGFAKNKKPGLARKDGPVGPHLGLGSENLERVKKPKKMVKQIISSTQPDGPYISMENISGDKKDVSLILDDYLYMGWSALG